MKSILNLLRGLRLDINNESEKNIINKKINDIIEELKSFKNDIEDRDEDDYDNYDEDNYDEDNYDEDEE